MPCSSQALREHERVGVGTVGGRSIWEPVLAPYTTFWGKRNVVIKSFGQWYWYLSRPCSYSCHADRRQETLESKSLLTLSTPRNVDPSAIRKQKPHSSQLTSHHATLKALHRARTRRRLCMLMIIAHTPLPRLTSTLQRPIEAQRTAPARTHRTEHPPTVRTLAPPRLRLQDLLAHIARLAQTPAHRLPRPQLVPQDRRVARALQLDYQIAQEARMPLVLVVCEQIVRLFECEEVQHEPSQRRRVADRLIQHVRVAWGEN